MEAEMRLNVLRRLKFSLRSLLALPLIVAIYFVLGGPTKRSGLRDVEQFVLYKDDSRQPARYHSPLLVTVSETDFSVTLPDQFAMETKTTYYFWLFGFVMPLRESVVTDAFVEAQYQESISS